MPGTFFMKALFRSPRLDELGNELALMQQEKRHGAVMLQRKPALGECAETLDLRLRSQSDVLSKISSTSSISCSSVNIFS